MYKNNDTSAPWEQKSIRFIYLAPVWCHRERGEWIESRNRKVSINDWNSCYLTWGRWCARAQWRRSGDASAGPPRRGSVHWVAAAPPPPPPTCRILQRRRPWRGRCSRQGRTALRTRLSPLASLESLACLASLAPLRTLSSAKTWTLRPLHFLISYHYVRPLSCKHDMRAVDCNRSWIVYQHTFSMIDVHNFKLTCVFFFQLEFGTHSDI